jgi:hypothetical protein
VVCVKCVIMKPRRNEEAQAHIGLSSHRKKNGRGVPSYDAKVISRKNKQNINRRIEYLSAFVIMLDSFSIYDTKP